MKSTLVLCGVFSFVFCGFVVFCFVLVFCGAVGCVFLFFAVGAFAAVRLARLFSVQAKLFGCETQLHVDSQIMSGKVRFTTVRRCFSTCECIRAHSFRLLIVGLSWCVVSLAPPVAGHPAFQPVVFSGFREERRDWYPDTILPKALRAAQHQAARARWCCCQRHRLLLPRQALPYVTHGSSYCLLPLQFVCLAPSYVVFCHGRFLCNHRAPPKAHLPLNHQSTVPWYTDQVPIGGATALQCWE